MLEPKLAAILIAGGSVLVPAAGCGTDAVGVSTCRDIEYARCEAAPSCPKLFDVPDVHACKRFYRDQCLHGLAASHEPGAPKVRACVEAIRKAGRCAKSGESLTDCGSLQDDSTGAKNTCDVIQSPEKLDACAFLQPEPEAASSGDDDDDGSAGSSSGSDNAAAGSD
jgi:hypothetical protein